MKMSNVSSGPASGARASIYELKWSKADKAVAQKAFDLALDREFDAVIREARDRAARAREPDDLWNLERFLNKSRKEIDRKYDYRYSQLTFVFGILVREGRLSLDELRGLSENKLDYIRRMVSL
jgi:hypothetical protein